MIVYMCSEWQSLRVLCCVACISTELFANETQDTLKTIAITPIQSIQIALTDYAEAVHAIKNAKDPINLREVNKLVQVSLALAAVDPVELDRQIIWKIAYGCEGKQAMTGCLFRSLWMNSYSMVELVAPLLDISDDKHLEEACHKILTVIELDNADVGYDFEYHQSYLGSCVYRKQPVPTGFTHRMFNLSPSQAFGAFVSVYGREEHGRALRLARQIIDSAIWKRTHGFIPFDEPDIDVTNQIEMLVGCDEFWARLYAAEIVKRYPPFGSSEIISKLRSDSDTLVRRVADSIRIEPSTK